MCCSTRTSVVTYNSSVPLRFLQVGIGFLFLGVSGFPRPGYYPVQGRFFYPAFRRAAGGGTILDTEGESQWAAARALLSTLTIPEMIYGVRRNRNRMLKTVLRLGRRFGSFLPSEVSAVPRFLRNSAGRRAERVDGG